MKNNFTFILLLIFLFSCNSYSIVIPEFSERERLGELDNLEIDEASGLAASINFPGILWTHNDSGGKPRLYAIDEFGKYLGYIELNGVNNRDWEDMAIARNKSNGISYIYIGEIGDNNAIYPTKYIYYFPEPEVLPSQLPFAITISDFNTISFRYEDKNIDAETLLVYPADDELYVITKREKFAVLYSIPEPQDDEEVIASELAVLKVGENRTGSKLSQIVAGDISYDGREIILKSYDSVYYFQRIGNETLVQALIKEPIALPYIVEPQGEAICWSSNADGYYTLSERSPFDITPVLYFYRRINPSINNNIAQITVQNTIDSFIIDLNISKGGNYDFTVFDINGKELFTLYKGYLPYGHKHFTMGLNGYGIGLYKLVLTGKDGFISEKVLYIK